MGSGISPGINFNVMANIIQFSKFLILVTIKFANELGE